MEDIQVIKEFLSESEREGLFLLLTKHTQWHEELFIVGTNQTQTKKIKRKMAYVSETPTMYRYANLEFPGTVWSMPLLGIVDRLGKVTGKEFNSVLMNYYKNGRDEIKWHSDKEETLGENPVIACVNLGATRKFWFKKIGHGNKPFFHEVADGDLLIMGENCQKNYLHAILKEPDVVDPRISLTYRYNY